MSELCGLGSVALCNMPRFGFHPDDPPETSRNPPIARNTQVTNELKNPHAQHRGELNFNA